MRKCNVCKYKKPDFRFKKTSDGNRKKPVSHVNVPGQIAF